MLRKGAIAVAVCAALAASSLALISASSPDPEAVPSSDEVAGRIMSPFCPGLSLAECPSEQASELRGQIEARIASGATNRDIDQWLVADYGESVLARPAQAISWIVPAAFVLGGFAAVAFFLGAGKGKKSATSDPASDSEGAEPEWPAAVGGRLDTGETPPPSALRAQMLEDLALFSKGTE